MKTRKSRRRHGQCVTSRLTSKYRTTVPKEIRSELDLKSGDKIVYELLKDGTVIVRKNSPMDIEYLHSLDAIMNEWESEEDERAYKNL